MVKVTLISVKELIFSEFRVPSPSSSGHLDWFKSSCSGRLNGTSGVPPQKLPHSCSFAIIDGRELKKKMW